MRFIHKRSLNRLMIDEAHTKAYRIGRNNWLATVLLFTGNSQDECLPNSGFYTERLLPEDDRANQRCKDSIKEAM
jgi:hypothetical protein